MTSSIKDDIAHPERQNTLNKCMNKSGAIQVENWLSRVEPQREQCRGYFEVMSECRPSR